MKKALSVAFLFFLHACLPSSKLADSNSNPITNGNTNPRSSGDTATVEALDIIPVPVVGGDTSNGGSNNTVKDGTQHTYKATGVCRNNFVWNGTGCVDGQMYVATCSDEGKSPKQTCLYVESVQIPIATTNVKGIREILRIGQWVGSGTAEIGILFSEQQSLTMLVVDQDAERVVANLSMKGSTFAGFIRGPEGSHRPFVSSSYDQHPSETYVCVYAPGFNDEGCAAGFGRWNTLNYSQHVRHTGGLLWDVDNDGYQDLHYFSYSPGAMFVISGRNGTSLQTVALDMSFFNSKFNSYPKGFDSGRIYGTQTAYQKDGNSRLLLMGGFPAGTFSGDSSVTMCNVTRYVALMSGPTGANSRVGIWGAYNGFYQHVPAGPNPSCTGNQTGDCYTGQMLDGCIHRSGNSLISIKEKNEAIAYSEFRAEAFFSSEVSPLCENEQLAYQRTWSDPEKKNFYNCLIVQQRTKGQWSLIVRDEKDGKIKLKLPNKYLWAIIKDFVPGKTVLIIEEIPAGLKFNRDGYSPENLFVYEVMDSLESIPLLGKIPTTGYPSMKSIYPPDSAHGTTGQSYVDIEKRINADGNLEVKVGDQWIYYDTSSKSFLIKP